MPGHLYIFSDRINITRESPGKEPYHRFKFGKADEGQLDVRLCDHTCSNPDGRFLATFNCNDMDSYKAEGAVHGILKAAGCFIEFTFDVATGKRGPIEWFYTKSIDAVVALANAVINKESTDGFDNDRFDKHYEPTYFGKYDVHESAHVRNNMSYPRYKTRSKGM